VRVKISSLNYYFFLFIYCSLFQVTQVELHRQFHNLGAGVIEEVRIQRDKGFGFVRYNTHKEAALAIQMANGKIVCGKSMKVSFVLSFLFSTSFFGSYQRPLLCPLFCLY